MNPVSCPNCGDHDLTRFHRRVYVHRECPASDSGATEWKDEVRDQAPACGEGTGVCPACGQPCAPVRIVCPSCNVPVEEQGED